MSDFDDLQGKLSEIKRDLPPEAEPGCLHCTEAREALRKVSVENSELAEEVSGLMSTVRKQARGMRALERLLREKRASEASAEIIAPLLVRWREMHSNTRADIDPGGARWERVREWLGRPSVTATDIEDAISGIRWSEHHMGFNDRDKPFKDIEHILNKAKPRLFEEFRDAGRKAREEGLEPPDFTPRLTPKEFAAHLEQARRERVGNSDAEPLPDEAMLQAWTDALCVRGDLLQRVAEVRRWTGVALGRLKVGWDQNEKRFTIPYYNGAGELVGLGRYRPGGQPKMIGAKGRRRELFPPPESIEGDTIFLVEGEPDAITGHSIGIPAVGVPGSNGWSDDFAVRLAGSKLYIIPDCDIPGRELARRIVDEMRGAPNTTTKIIDLAPGRWDKYDLSDWVMDGGTAEQLWAMASDDDLAAAA